MNQYRFELDQMMYSRVGAEALDALVTQKLVSQELRNRKFLSLLPKLTSRLKKLKTVGPRQ